MSKSEVASMAKQEAQWRAESDADTLIRAAEIKNDPDRLKAAKKILQEKKAAANTAMKDATSGD
jgi:hypothetical protein